MSTAATLRRRNVLVPPKRRPSIRPRELWHYRELVYMLAWRDVNVRYNRCSTLPGSPKTFAMLWKKSLVGLPTENLIASVESLCSADVHGFIELFGGK